MSEYNNVESKLEAVFKKVLDDAAIAGLTNFTGLSASNLQLPKSHSYAHTGQDIIPESGTGIYRVPVEIAVESVGLTDPNDTEPLTAHKTLVAAVRDTLLVNNLVTLLNAAAATLALQLTVVDAFNHGTVEDTEHTNFRNILNLEVIAANASI